MNLYEYQAKKLFSQFDIPILEHWICFDISDIKKYKPNLISIGPPWTVKCQIQAGGRGKAGGVQIVHSLEHLQSYFNRWLGKSLITNQTTGLGEIVNCILIEPTVKIIHEFYISVSIDRDKSQVVCMVSTTGGVNIENTINEFPNLINKIVINPISGAYPYQGRILANKLGLTGKYINQFVRIYINIVHMFLIKDLTLVEINPLIIDSNDNLLCLDAKVNMDRNSSFRQSELLKLCTQNDTINNNFSLIPSKMGINYIALNGNIGCMVNGAGLAMATMDLIKLFGANPANFLDIGGDANTDSIILAFKILLQTEKIKVIFVNIFGGIVCCNLIANSIIMVLSKCITHIPIIVRLEGNNALLGSNKLTNSNFNIIVINNLFNAIQKVIELVK